MNYKDYKRKKDVENTWEKANFTSIELNFNQMAKDYAGAVIRFAEYGQKGEYGWEIMHIVPASKTPHYNDERNICPVHWRNLQSKADNFPSWETVLSSNDNVINQEHIKKWECIQGLIRNKD